MGPASSHYQRVFDRPMAPLSPSRARPMLSNPASCAGAPFTHFITKLAKFGHGLLARSGSAYGVSCTPRLPTPGACQSMLACEPAAPCTGTSGSNSNAPPAHGDTGSLADGAVAGTAPLPAP